MQKRTLNILLVLVLVLCARSVKLLLAGSVSLSSIDPATGKPFMPGTQHTIRSLFTLINGRNPAWTSQFLLLAPHNGKVPLAESRYLSLSKDDFRAMKMGSVSPSFAQDTAKKPLKNLLLLSRNSPGLDTVVTLKPWTKAHAAARSMPQSANAYFVWHGYMLFINDPWG